MKINSITYISCSTVPSVFANSVHVMKMCNSFSARGVKVTLVCKQSQEWHGEQDALDSYNCNNGFKLAAFRIRTRGLLFSLSYIFFAMYHVKRAKGVVYARYFYPLFPLFFSRKPYILEFHNDINKIDKFIALRLMKRSSCRQLVFISEALKNHFVKEYGANDEICSVLPDACDVATDTGGSNSTDVGYVGHLYSGRGIELLEKVAKKLPNVIFHIIGGKEPELSQFRSSSPDNMIFYGAVRHSDLPNYYKKFSIALAPYQEKIFSADKRCETSSYCSPMKLFEYMSYKKAIICSDLPVFHEVGNNLVDLLFVNSSDVDGWVEAIKKLLLDVNLRDFLINNSYERFIHRYTWIGRVDSILNYLSDSNP